MKEFIEIEFWQSGVRNTAEVHYSQIYKLNGYWHWKQYVLAYCDREIAELITKGFIEN